MNTNGTQNKKTDIKHKNNDFRCVCVGGGGDGAGG